MSERMGASAGAGGEQRILAAVDQQSLGDARNQRDPLDWRPPGGDQNTMITPGIQSDDRRAGKASKPVRDEPLELRSADQITENATTESCHVSSSPESKANDILYIRFFETLPLVK
ncbi:MAG: hypothetical protein BWY66_02731 [bacterium ADurb.Bin374]|nr:MAG: hypothetical protein BWY66_02731 [bacterium ADurb.Bin374]